MELGQGWKQRLAKKLDACDGGLNELDGKLDGIGEEIAAVRTALTEARPLAQTPGEELYKLREAISTGTMVLREENRELRRRQEKMLGGLKDLHLEITSDRLGAHPPPSEADAGGEAGEETTRPVVDPPPTSSGGVPEAQDGGQHEQEESVNGERDGNRRDLEDDAAKSPGGEAPEGQRVREVKRAAEAALRHRSHGSGDGSGGATAPPGAGGQTPRTPRDPLEEHAELLLTAAGLSRAELICHRDTWEFLLVQAARHPRFRVPGAVDDHGEDRVRTHLSGPSLITALISLWETRNAPSETVDVGWAMATRVYDRIRARLAGAGPGDGRRTVRIVLDDGAEAADDSFGAPGREAEAA
ncbi:hypothetical protein V1L54_17175 [Streptomyces sp. TRM 70361]|uniref:hypothetical protein n=1 Tax=Streptomyces sp. TRM 70361 TaxID=3116553 RepID=UPI002E7C4A15|nr:hypothetical protein [Streptomyces sp. TRM 70361]MEE1941113.1 hypothetical protein [Streptomyces sp. TRM 70361]